MPKRGTEAVQPIAVDLPGFVRFPQPALLESGEDRIEHEPDPNPLLTLSCRALLDVQICST